MKAKIALPILLAVLAAILLCRRDEAPPLAPDPMAQWVCDHCGKTMAAPQGDTSMDCPHCDRGQMVQRIYFTCKKCGTTFEAYQLNRSPDAPRGAEAKKAADAAATGECGAAEDEEAPEGDEAPEGEKAPVEHEPGAALVRRPGGSWVWECTDPGRLILHHLRCPKCGELPRAQFAKVLNPPSPK